MKIEDLIIEGKKHLSSSEAKMLLASITGYDSLELLLHLDEEMSIDDIDKYKKMIKAVKNNYPIQYIIGNVSFLGNDIKVNDNVLIPRFETEDMVDRSIKYIKSYFGDKKDLKIVDLGTGSGCIAISLKKAFPNAQVDAVDISDKAIELATENASINGSNVNFYIDDMINFLNDEYDVIISNPPYIEEDSSEVEEIVLNNEPSLALFAANNGLYFYEEILKKVSHTISAKAMIIFEIGYMQGASIEKLCNQYLQDANFILEKDMSDKDRFVFIYI